MSAAEVALESPRRSLRRSVLEHKQPSSDSLKSTNINGNKRHFEDDAPILDSSVSTRDEDYEDEEEEEGGPPPLKKVARSSTGGTIMWKTATGAPKQLAFKKVPTSASNGSSMKTIAAATVSAASTNLVPPTNLATALAGLLPQPTPVANFPKRPLIIKPQVHVPRLTNPISSTSSSNLVRRRIDVVNNEICNDCTKSLPSLRRSLGRLEARMEAVTSMIKQIVNKHSQQNVAFTRPSTSVPRSSIASPLNGSKAMGNPTAMRFVPVGGRNASSPSSPTMKKFVAEKSSRLAKGSLMHRMISRGLLTYRMPSLTAEEYYKQAPVVIKAHTLKQVQQVMLDLVASGLYIKSDPSVDAMDPECIFEKVKDIAKLSALSDYDVPSADYLEGCFDI